MSSLKAELLGETTPEFTMTLPEGWVRRAADDRQQDEMLAEVKKNLMATHRPDLYGQASGMVKKVFAEMKRVETVAFFGPGPDAPAQAFLPATLTASILRGRDGESLDSVAAQLIRAEGATPLGEDKRFLRYEQQSKETFEGTTVDTTTVVYFTPVPASDRTRALRLTLVITHDTTAPGDDEYVSALKFLFDGHIATFAWIPA